MRGHGQLHGQSPGHLFEGTLLDLPGVTLLLATLDSRGRPAEDTGLWDDPEAQAGPPGAQTPLCCEAQTTPCLPDEAGAVRPAGARGARALASSRERQGAVQCQGGACTWWRGGDRGSPCTTELRLPASSSLTAASLSITWVCLESFSKRFLATNGVLLEKTTC